MSNIAGKSYAMNLITPLEWFIGLQQKVVFWAVGTRFFKNRLNGLVTLSLIHYARWVIVKASEFPRLSETQPEEELHYNYMFFFSNFNGSWAQYVDSFSAAIPVGLNLLWRKNVKWPTSVPETPFHRYVTFNQAWTDHYYNAYPMAASNDVKSAIQVRKALLPFIDECSNLPAQEFQVRYNRLMLSLQEHLSQMAPTPIVSLAAEAVAKRRGVEK